VSPDAGWATTWAYLAALPEGTPSWAVAIVALTCVYGAVILPSSAAMSYLERKLSADFQARVGPNRAGPAGILQPIADLFKLLQKESSGRRSWRETLWLGVHTMALYSTVAVLPLGSLVLLVDTDMSAFLPFWAALVLALGTMLLGLNQGSVPGWVGGIRVASQALAGAFPALIAILCAGVRAGSFRWSALAGSQSGSPFHWAAFANPFQFVAMMVFVASGLVLLGIPPLDGGVSLPDIHGGVSSHLHGRRLSLFRLGRFYGFFLWSVIAVVLFLGDWTIPEVVRLSLVEAEAWRTLQLLELGTLLGKTFALMLVVVTIARVTPRLRADQITDLSWRVLSPFALVALGGAALWTGWVNLS
jgi:NADH-quinone oxidoreductase subunit H